MFLRILSQISVEDVLGWLTVRVSGLGSRLRIISTLHLAFFVAALSAAFLPLSVFSPTPAKNIILSVAPA